MDQFGFPRDFGVANPIGSHCRGVFSSWAISKIWTAHPLADRQRGYCQFHQFHRIWMKETDAGGVGGHVFEMLAQVQLSWHDAPLTTRPAECKKFVQTCRSSDLRDDPVAPVNRQKRNPAPGARRGAPSAARRMNVISLSVLHHAEPQAAFRIVQGAAGCGSGGAM